VVPISYAVKREQHAFNLASYKRRPGSDTVRADLLALIQVPLQLLVGTRLRLPWLRMSANTKIRPESRAFHADRFSVEEPAGKLDGAAVLVLDDTWTTGSRVQSASYALRAAGASTVVAVVLGRHVNPDWEPWQPILKTVKKTPFDLDRCAVHSGRAG
jgi:hypothetical protein